MPTGKRETNFLGGEKYMNNGWDWWITRFSKASSGQIVGDVSVDYIYSKSAPKLIKNCLGQPKFIAILRDPIERIISAYFWNIRRGLIPNLNINEGIKYASDSKKTNLSTQAKEIYKNLINRGFYDEQIENYLHYHDLKQFYFISYDDIKSRPKQVIQNVYKFLHIDHNYIPKIIDYKPKKNSYIPLLISLERAVKNYHLLSKSLDLINFLASVLHFNRKPPSLDPLILNKLKSTYRPHNQKLKIIVEKHQKVTSYSYKEISDWIEELEKWND